MAKSTTEASIDVHKIVDDDKLYPRAELRENVVNDYAQLMQGDTHLPPIVVFQDKSAYHLADGRHRLEAARRIGHTEVMAEVRKGDRRDALLHAVGANAAHGLRRTGADKRKAVQLLLDDPEWQQWSVEAIAKTCNVSWGLVDKVRSVYLLKSEDSERRVKRGDSVFNQKMGNRKGGERKTRTPLRALGEMRKLIAEARLLAIESDEYSELTNRLPEIAERLERLVGRQTGAARLSKGLLLPLNVYERPRTGGIERNEEFEKKGLATYDVNVGMGCGHGCFYCSSPSLRRMNGLFQELESSAFTSGIAVVDPATPERLRRRVPKLTEDDVVLICALDDAWSPEARRHKLGRRCLEVVLAETPAQVRVLTKSHYVRDEFDLIEKHRDRIIVGLSTGAPASREHVAQVIEPNASSVSERLATLQLAHETGLRTFGMICPVLPGIATRARHWKRRSRQY